MSGGLTKDPTESRASNFNRKARPLALFAILFCLTCPTVHASDSTAKVLVELFTSQGCSSCPPADRLLEQLSRLQVAGLKLVTLSEHVDYWNYLGWKDPYSRNEFSQRQRKYCAGFGRSGVYTPQMIVDGIYEIKNRFSGDILATARKSARLPKADVSITARNQGAMVKAEVEIKNLPEQAQSEAFSVRLFLTENNVQTRVPSGENANRTLRHSSVARAMLTSPLTTKSTSQTLPFSVNLPPGLKQANLDLVAVVQGDSSNKIIGIGLLRLDRL